MPNPNLEQLIAAAALLRPILGDLVFVGGAVTSLLVTDEGAGLPRATLDVDAIAEISPMPNTLRLANSAPLCRWVHSGTILDVMPLDEKILGFSNRWYRVAMEVATTHRLFRDLEIRVVTAPYFLATKIEAFKGRGRGDFLASHDLEDLIFVIDGRSTIVEEVQTDAPLLREYLQKRNRQIAGGAGIHRRPAWVLAARCCESGKNRDGPSTIESSRLLVGGRDILKPWQPRVS